jgi:hypothetical protein
MSRRRKERAIVTVGISKAAAGSISQKNPRDVECNLHRDISIPPINSATKAPIPGLSAAMDGTKTTTLDRVAAIRNATEAKARIGEDIFSETRWM